MNLLADKKFVAQIRVAVKDIAGFQQFYKGDVDTITIQQTLKEALRLAKEGKSAEDLFDFYSPHGGSPLVWVNGFFREFSAELKRIICDKKALGSIAKTAGYSAKAASTALAAWLMQVFGHPEPVAIGAAAVLLLILTEATKGAFCKMTDKEVEAVLEEPQRQREKKKRGKK